ncbi:MAG TPA: PqqD family protein [Thermoanaerobaculaceae bacterium]|nr:PqqD family protein [Thermoanaerobaculaceae bacterium]
MVPPNPKPDVRWDDVVCAASAQVSSRVGDEVAVLGLDRAVYFGLNPVGARIWELVQKPVRLDRVAEAIVAEYEVDESTVRSDLMELVERLLAEGLLELRDGTAP